jgi:hypothetical protein
MSSEKELLNLWEELSKDKTASEPNDAPFVSGYVKNTWDSIKNNVNYWSNSNVKRNKRKRKASESDEGIGEESNKWYKY